MTDDNGNGDIDALRDSYDELPYVGTSHRQSHPDHLAVLARLFGMAPADVRGCRVLELGCATGRNLLPMAQELPGTEFVGIDFSLVQVEQGRALQRELGLTNIELRHGRIEEMTEADGQFDYVIAHGVYSWVPLPVRLRLFEVCQRHLAPQGVAYVDFNTYPGWHVRGLIRDMMLFHTARFKTAREKVHHARGVLNFVAASTPASRSAYQSLLMDELKVIQDRPDWYIYHDHLEGVNDPVYFHEFMAQAGARGLQYLADAFLAVMSAGTLGAEVERQVHAMARDLVELEQYLDFLRNRMFRQTLLARADVALDRHITTDRLAGMYVAADVRTDKPDMDVRVKGQEVFHFPDGLSLGIPDPVAKATLVFLSRAWPAAVPYEALRDGVVEMLGATGGAAADELSRAIGTGVLHLFSRDMMRVYPRPLRCVGAVSDRPVGSPFARSESRESEEVTNAAHERALLEPAAQQVLRLLDGTRGRAELAAALGGGLDAAAKVEAALDALRLRRLLVG